MFVIQEVLYPKLQKSSVENGHLFNDYLLSFLCALSGLLIIS